MCRRYLWIVLSSMSLLPLVTGQCNLTVGVYSISNLPTTAAPFYNVSNLCVELFNDTTTFIQAVSSQQIDLVYCTPTLNNCFLSEFNLQPVAGLVANHSAVISGDILVNRASPFQTLQDLRGTRLICGPPYITAIFQIQAAAFNQPNFFAFFSVIRFESNQTTILQALAQQSFDVAFFRSDQINIFWAGDFHSQFRLLDERVLQGQVYTSSTRAYPQWEVTAQPYITIDEIKEIYNRLAVLPSFGPSYSYRSYLQLLQDLRLLSPNGSCLVTSQSDIYSYITCPEGTIKLTAARVQQNCEAYPDQCSQAFCTCSPCFQPDTQLAFGLQPLPFWLVLFATTAGSWALSWTVQMLQTGESIVPRVAAERIQESSGQTVLVGGPDPVPVSLMEVPARTPWSKSAVWQRIADCCRVTHPNIVKVHGVMRRGSKVWVVHAPVLSTLRQHLDLSDCDYPTALRLAREAATGLQHIHTDRHQLLHRSTMQSVVIDTDGHAQLFLPYFDQQPTINPAHDTGFFAAVVLDMIRDTAFPTRIMKQCTHSHLRLRPSITQVVVHLTSVEQQVQASYLQLLNSLLPPAIAERLSQGDEIEFELHNAVAIIFTDIVGFTTLCSTMHPADVGRLLVRLYAKFDRLAVEFGIHKQEIVGDCWVGVTNLVTDQSSDYVTRMAEFAVQLLSSAQETQVLQGDVEDRRVVVRVGIHVGTVVAGVVGVTVPKYCVFGAPINVAARMESTSLPGRIHLSEAAATAIAQQAPHLATSIIARDHPIDVKGLGLMQTYWFES